MIQLLSKKLKKYFIYCQKPEFIITPHNKKKTFVPYAFLVTTSGAIQYGVPTIVDLLLCSGVIWAQNPKSAAKINILVCKIYLTFNKLLCKKKVNNTRNKLNLTLPCIPSKMLSLLISLWITFLLCKNSNACRHC